MCVHNSKLPDHVANMVKYRQLQADECPPGYTSGNAFTSVCINTSIYLPWLVSQCLKAGVVFKRGMFNHISEAALVHHTGRLANVVVNCTGLSARKLGGVMDENMIPARGQTVLVRNEPNIMCDVSGTSEGDEEVCYVMQRAAGKRSQISPMLTKSLIHNRWRDTTRRFVSERQLGFSNRPQSRYSYHEARDRGLSILDRRKGY